MIDFEYRGNDPEKLSLIVLEHLWSGANPKILLDEMRIRDGGQLLRTKHAVAGRLACAFWVHHFFSDRISYPVIAPAIGFLRHSSAVCASKIYADFARRVRNSGEEIIFRGHPILLPLNEEEFQSRTYSFETGQYTAV